mmetsp:Transcript_28121/g.77332  ORF Transcript_28121/g.77332 Transcript_28121/m.77332 type:complete len:1025 (+) Transcript_28121:244-3318(+)|eukprot:CAMPEP_0168728600 /NCGR_PEP_ID=MMETSP0724-20121128/5769_1 /TAXON_ID=265536 /ORGANISM="Amphiprora sp., Strain CCMP467" /LENGTH=1024 /DNA_ID=CAMNT_0008775453 /DNA_START=161 /DNA_END=3235 /DNA_ORIENTATION=+
MPSKPAAEEEYVEESFNEDEDFEEEDYYDTNIPPSLEQDVRLVEEPGAFKILYKLLEEIGQGAFAKVYAAAHRPTGSEYAVKKINRKKMIWGDRDALQDEINSLVRVREGPNIVQLYEVYEEEVDCFLIMELMRGGELFERILQKREFTEREARDCVKGMLRGLEYMHERRVAHRDLKPENLLLEDDTGHNVKLADFGFAKRCKQHNGLRTLCGTPGYLAPEILERWPAYDVKCDLWSVGVILFLLLGGYLPFEDEDEDRVFERTRNGEYDFHPTYWKGTSTAAKTLVTRMLTVNPEKRFSAEDALKHDWILKGQDDDTMQKQVNVDKLRENVTANKQNEVAKKDRVKDLEENFAGYLERTKEQDQEKSRVQNDKAARKPGRKFEEDSKSGKPFDDFYDLGDVLGEGGYACVYRATHRKTGDIYAVKDVNTGVLEKSNKSALIDEIAAMKLLRGGPHIIRLYDVFEEPDHTFMIMEEMRGGDLLTRISDKEVYTEREARKTCKILFEAMDYIHKKKIAHRDIKPENVLMVEQEDDTSIKIADFGFAKRVPKPNCLRTLCGTAQYVAPEVLDLQSAGYDQRSDMWSVGVVVYILLGGYAPFEGPVQELARAICRADYCFHDKYWSEISDAAKEMISCLLQIDPEVRYSADDALQCHWMTMEEGALMVTDLSAAKEAIQKRAEEGTGQVQGIKKLNKLESLDVSFTAGLGTFEEVAKRRGKRTELDTLDESNESNQKIEDSTSGKPFEALYNWGRAIEDGEFTVHECRHKQSKQIVAVKKLEIGMLDPLDAVALQSEIECLKAVSDSPFVVRLHDVFEDPDFTFMVLERMRGGDLIDKVIERKHYTEDEARLVARKVLMGLEHCHSRRIAIRNIKAESLLIVDEHSYVDVKISDFSFAKKVLFPNALRTQCGTEGYVAPEVLHSRPAYDVQCDMWSLGVVLYILLGGYRPFRGDDDEEVERKIRYGEYKFHKRYWKEISEDAKILISRMLTVNPIARITATGALSSDWFLMEDEDSEEESDDTEDA